jgi:hypothetical protein
VGGPAASIPRVAPEQAEWHKANGCALVRGRGERAESSSAEMSVMMVVLKLAKDRQDTYSSIITKAHQAIDDKHKF